MGRKPAYRAGSRGARSRTYLSLPCFQDSDPGTPGPSAALPAAALPPPRLSQGKQMPSSQVKQICQRKHAQDPAAQPLAQLRTGAPARASWRTRLQRLQILKSSRDFRPEVWFVGKTSAKPHSSLNTRQAWLPWRWSLHRTEGRSNLI